MKNILCILALCACAAAQQLSPVINECGKHCGGQFTVTNKQLQPMAVTLQPMSFSIVDGKPNVRPLDSTVDVDLREMSARVGPLADHTFDYTIRCRQFPCLVYILVSMTAGHTAEGMQMRVILPSVHYICAKGRDCREAAFRAAGMPY